ncbi:hypothetical protein CRG98_040616 [Punica granatum]|uniref:Uncharacterized protein n=1 Tax=Punica granatum TaxID=22663 RepID=A0A2I0I4V2_PUNGR|nr:hypothetical protein CRG98_040616 [Punica granatum]
MAAAATRKEQDRDHFFTGEGEGCEEPLERDGTTRRSRREKRHVGRLGCARLRFRDPTLCVGGTR